MSMDAARPLLVEIVGVAGSGKSTLAAALCVPEGSFRLVEQMRLRRIRHLVVAARGMMRILLPLADLLRMRRLKWTDTKLLIFLETWGRFARQSSNLDGDVAVFDQGPIYGLARLQTSVVDLGTVQRFARWRAEMIDRWSEDLDVIVWLDAPNQTLTERINNRERSHEVKHGTEETTTAYLDAYRSAFAEVVDVIESSGGPVAVRIDTSRIRQKPLAVHVASVILAAADALGSR